MPSSARSTRSCAAAALPSSADQLGLRRPRLGPAAGGGEAAGEQAPALDVVGTLGEDGAAAARSAPRPRRAAGGGIRPATSASAAAWSGGPGGARQVGKAGRAEPEVEPRRGGEPEPERRAPAAARDSRRGAVAAGASAASASAAASRRRETSSAAGGGLLGAQHAAVEVGLDLAELVAKQLHVVAGAALGARRSRARAAQRQPEARDRDEPRDQPEEPVDHQRLAIPRRTLSVRRGRHNARGRPHAERLCS